MKQNLHNIHQGTIHKERITKLCKNCQKPFSVVPFQSKKMFCSQKCHYEFKRGKTFIQLYGKHSFLRRKKSYIEHDQEVLKQQKNLEKKGFRCIPISLIPIPDIIAFKHNEIFAVEVQRYKPNPCKYNSEVRKYYDDIFWMIFSQKHKVKKINDKK